MTGRDQWPIWTNTCTFGAFAFFFETYNCRMICKTLYFWTVGLQSWPNGMRTLNIGDGPWWWSEQIFNEEIFSLRPDPNIFGQNVAKCLTIMSVHNLDFLQSTWYCSLPSVLWGTLMAIQTWSWQVGKLNNGDKVTGGIGFNIVHFLFCYSKWEGVW